MEYRISEKCPENTSDLENLDCECKKRMGKNNRIMREIQCQKI